MTIISNVVLLLSHNFLTCAIHNHKCFKTNNCLREIGCGQLGLFPLVGVCRVPLTGKSSKQTCNLLACIAVHCVHYTLWNYVNNIGLISV